MAAATRVVVLPGAVPARAARTRCVADDKPVRDTTDVAAPRGRVKRVAVTETDAADEEDADRAATTARTARERGATAAEATRDNDPAVCWTEEPTDDDGATDVVIDRPMTISRATMVVTATTTDADRPALVCRVARGDDGVALPAPRTKASTRDVAMDAAICDTTGIVRTSVRAAATATATATVAPRTGLLPVETKADDEAAVSRARVEVDSRPCVMVDAREMDAARGYAPMRVATAEIIVETDTARTRTVAPMTVVVGVTDANGARA